jgi:carotenoid 1,2-hydratase
MHVALYGKRHRWAMTERGRAALQRDATHLGIGPSSLAWDGTTLTATLAERCCPIPRAVRGTIRLHPPGISTHEVDLAGNGRHRWSPIAPRARIEVALEQPSLSWSGTAYFDTNSGDEPLEDSFASWDWFRAPMRQGTAVVYDRVLRDGRRLATGLRYDPVGAAEPFHPPPRTRMQDTLWRLHRHAHADPGERMWVAQTLTDSPFYARSVVQGTLLGQSVTAVHESLSLDRFRAPWVQAMLPFKAPRAFQSRASP